MSLADDLQKLEDLRQSGALTDEEFEIAKQRVLGGTTSPSASQPTRDGESTDGMAAHLAAIAAQNKVAQLDREWEFEREEFMIQGRRGLRRVPRRRDTLFIGPAAIGSGIVFLVIASSFFGALAGPSDAGFAMMFAFVGTLVMLIIGFSLYHQHQRATEYEAAHQQYQKKRRKLTGEDTGEEDEEKHRHPIIRLPE